MAIIDFQDYKNRHAQTDAPSEDELQMMMEEMAGEMNDSPNPITGGLSPNQFSSLINSKWDNADSPIQLRVNLESETLLESSKMFRQAHTFLMLFRERQPLKATATLKYLPRSFIEELVDAILSPEYVQDLRYYRKRLNEYDIPRIEALHTLLEMANLIKIRSGKFSLVKASEHMLEQGEEGLLFESLLMTFMDKMYFGFWLVRDDDGIDLLQDSIAYTLYRLSEVARDWRLIDDALLNEILIPTILDRLSEISKPTFDDGACKFMAREFFPLLADWGLLEGIYKQSSTDISYPNQLESVRITPLFDQILHFDLNLVSDEVEPFFSADDIPGMIIDSEAEERHNRIIADKIIQVVETGLDDFIACEEDCASVFRLAIAFWNDAVASKYPNPPVLRSDIENRMFHELTGPSFEFADSEAMNFIDQMRKNWKRLCSHDTRVITGHKLNLNGNGPSLSVLTIDLEEEG